MQGGFASRFGVSGRGFVQDGFKFRVSGFGVRVPDFGCEICAGRFWVWGLKFGFWFGFGGVGVWGLGITIPMKSCFSRLEDLFQDVGLGFWVRG